jgi:hypothetical protein
MLLFVKTSICNGVQSNGAAKYWKNGSMNGLTMQDFDASIATCIYGVGSDVFIGGDSGGVNHIWGYWMNGTFVTLPYCTNVYDLFVK